MNKASEYTDETIEISGRLSEKRTVGASHSVYGIIYHKQKDWVKASEHFEKSIKIAKSVENWGGT